MSSSQHFHNFFSSTFVVVEICTNSHTHSLYLCQCNRLHRRTPVITVMTALDTSMTCDLIIGPTYCQEPSVCLQPQILYSGNKNLCETDINDNKFVVCDKVNKQLYLSKWPKIWDIHLKQTMKLYNLYWPILSICFFKLY